MNDETERRLLEELKQTLHDEEVPDPGEPYWREFPGRVRRRIEERPRRRWPVWGGLAAAAALALFLIYLPGPRDETVPSATNGAVSAGEPEDLRRLLNELFGSEQELEINGESWELTDEEQKTLLESLRAEMENPV